MVRLSFFAGFCRPSILKTLLMISVPVFAQVGSLDTSFTPAVPLHGYVNVVLQNQKIIVNSDVTFSMSQRKQIVRLNPDGSLDKTFNFPFGTNLFVFTMTCQPDARIFVSGRFSTNETSAHEIKRLLPDGALDPTFSTNVGTNGWVYSMLAQSDGKILVAGNFREVNGAPTRAMVRLQADGSLDTTFNLQTNALHFRNLIFQPDGKILLIGRFAPVDLDFVWDSLFRITPDGAIDTTFKTRSRGSIEYAATQSDGKILFPAEIYNSHTDYVLERLLPDGTADPTFQRTRLGLNGGGKTLWRTTPLPDDKILLNGWFEDVNGTPRHNVARLNSDGSVDSTFDAGTAVPDIYSIAIQADGDIVLGGLETLLRLQGEPYLQFQALARDAAGSLNLSLTNRTGKAWVLQASSDLIEWTTLSTNTSSGTLSIDLSAPSHQRRFYRSFLP